MVYLQFGCGSNSSSSNLSDYSFCVHRSWLINDLFLVIYLFFAFILYNLICIWLWISLYIMFNKQDITVTSYRCYRCKVWLYNNTKNLSPSYSSDITCFRSIIYTSKTANSQPVPLNTFSPQSHLLKVSP